MKVYVILSILIAVLIVGCSTEEELIQSNYIPATPTQMGSITDCEGNQYPTVLIGSQEWMAENLRTACYANGEPTPNFPALLSNALTARIYAMLLAVMPLDVRKRSKLRINA